MASNVTGGGSGELVAGQVTVGGTGDWRQVR